MSMTYYAVTDDPNELAHFGIPGMKWGVRHDKPRHSGSRKHRSAAYKKAQNKLGRMMKSGIKKAEAHWKTYNSPAAKEARFMKKAMQQARTGTLKYGKLTDDQVRKVTSRLALERDARFLGSTENPRYAKRLKTAIGEGIIQGIGKGTTSYIDARFRGRGETTAAIKRDQRMAKYEGREDVQRNRARNKQLEEFYKTAYEEGVNPDNWRYSTNKSRAKYLSNVKARNKQDEYASELQKKREEQIALARGRYEGGRYYVERANRTLKSGGSGALERLNAYNDKHETANDRANYALTRAEQRAAAQRSQMEAFNNYLSTNTTRRRRRPGRA